MGGFWKEELFVPDTEMQIFNVIIKGGILMIPIALCSIVALAIIIERFISLRRASIDTREFMDTMAAGASPEQDARRGRDLR